MQLDALAHRAFEILWNSNMGVAGTLVVILVLEVQRCCTGPGVSIAVSNADQPYCRSFPYCRQCLSVLSDGSLEAQACGIGSVPDTFMYPCFSEGHEALVDVGEQRLANYSVAMP